MTSSNGIFIFTWGDLDTVGELLESDGTVIEDNDDGYAAHGIRNFLIWDSLPAGTYYVKVTSHDEATGDYVLKTTTIPDSTSRSNAQTLPLGDFGNGMIDPAGGDDDWFTFTLTEQTGVIVRGSGRIEGEILDSAGDPITGFESFDLPSSSFVHLAGLPAGTYYIRVRQDTFQRLGPYTLYTQEASEPGSTLAGALPLEFYFAAAGTIDSATDTDYLRIDVDEDTHVRLWAVGAEVDIAGQMLDSSGAAVSNAVLYEDTFESGGPVGFTLHDELRAGTHYIKVTPPPRASRAPAPRPGPMPCF